MYGLLGVSLFPIAHDGMGAWLSWLEHRLCKPRVQGSSPCASRDFLESIAKEPEG